MFPPSVQIWGKSHFYGVPISKTHNYFPSFMQLRCNHNIRAVIYKSKWLTEKTLMPTYFGIKNIGGWVLCLSILYRIEMVGGLLDIENTKGYVQHTQLESITKLLTWEQEEHISWSSRSYQDGSIDKVVYGQWKLKPETTAAAFNAQPWNYHGRVLDTMSYRSVTFTRLAIISIFQGRQNFQCWNLTAYSTHWQNTI